MSARRVSRGGAPTQGPRACAKRGVSGTRCLPRAHPNIELSVYPAIRPLVTDGERKLFASGRQRDAYVRNSRKVRILSPRAAPRDTRQGEKTRWRALRARLARRGLGKTRPSGSSTAQPEGISLAPPVWRRTCYTILPTTCLGA